MNKLFEVIFKGATGGIMIALARYFKENKQQILDKIYEISIENTGNADKLAKVMELLEKEGLFKYIMDTHKEMMSNEKKPE